MVLVFQKRHACLCDLPLSLVISARADRFCRLRNLLFCRRMDVPLFFQLQDSVHGIIQFFYRDIACSHSCQQSLHVLIHIGQSIDFLIFIQIHRTQQNIDVRIDRHHCGVNRVKVLVDRIHYHSIRDHDSVITHLLPEKAGDDRAGQSCRQIDLLAVRNRGIGLFLDLRELNMSGHDHIRALIDPCLERDQIASFNFLKSEIRAGKIRVAVLSHIAVAGEMFEGGRYFGRVHSPDEGRHVLSSKVRVVRK